MSPDTRSPIPALQMRTEEVPPPKEPPYYEASAKLGILPCLCSEMLDRQFRCAIAAK